MKDLITIFVSIFLAELGDKTQLATLFFATEMHLSRWQIFLAAASALTLSTLLAVLVGSQLSHWASPRALKTLAGIGFLVIGAWTLWRG